MLAGLESDNQTRSDTLWQTQASFWHVCILHTDLAYVNFSDFNKSDNDAMLKLNLNTLQQLLKLQSINNVL